MQDDYTRIRRIEKQFRELGHEERTFVLARLRRLHEEAESREGRRADDGE